MLLLFLTSNEEQNASMTFPLRVVSVQSILQRFNSFRSNEAKAINNCQWHTKKNKNKKNCVISRQNTSIPEARSDHGGHSGELN